MSQPHESRRAFLQRSALAGAAASLSLRWPAPSAQASGTQSPAPAPAHGAEADAPQTIALERRRFGKTDMHVALLGFGGAEIGYEKTDPATVEKLLNAALDIGLNVVDTAECYAESETQIGAAIAHRRKDFYLFTKCGHVGEPGSKDSTWSKRSLQASLERSLKRLKTDAVDLLQLHSCSLDELKKGEVIEALEQAKKEGKARYIGYSGDSDAALYAVECGRLDALQTSINICDQECIEKTLPLARDKQLGVIAKRPIANAAWRYDAQPDVGYHVEYWKRLQKLGYDFATGAARAQQGPDGPAAIAMRFTAMQPGVSVLIVGTTKPERWRQNAELLQAGALPKERLDAIRARWKAAATSEWVGQT